MSQRYFEKFQVSKKKKNQKKYLPCRLSLLTARRYIPPKPRLAVMRTGNMGSFSKEAEGIPWMMAKGVIEVTFVQRF